MSPPIRPPGERLATIETSLEALHNELADMKSDAREDHHRLRAVEALVTTMVTQQRDTVTRQHDDLERLVVRLQWAAVVIAALVLTLSVTLAVLTH